MESKSSEMKKEKSSNIEEVSGKNTNDTEPQIEKQNKPVQRKNSQNLTVKEIIDNLKKVIDESNISRYCINSSRDLVASSDMINSKESSSSLNKPVNINDRLTKLKNICKAYDSGSDDSSVKNSSEQQKGITFLLRLV